MEKNLPPQAIMMQMLNGKHISRSISIVADLAIPDLLKEGPRDATYLAAETGMNADALYRVLRTLSAVGVFEALPGKKFQNNALSDTLRSETPGSVRFYARWMGTHLHWDVISHLDYTVKTGIPSILKDNPGSNVFEVLARHEDAQQIFNEAMTGLSLADGHAIAEAYDFSSYERIMDVGGGHGVLAKIIAESVPGSKVSVFDQPHVVEGAREILAVAGLSDRITAIGGNFFDHVPGPVDLIVMKHIIHDWNDEKSVEILKNCKKALTDGGRIVLCEMLITPGPESVPAKIFDIEMLVGPGGKERNEAEYAALFEAAGMRLNRIIPTKTQVRLIEGK